MKYLVALSFLAALSTAANTKQFTVDTGYAIFLGNHTRPNTVAYLGVPYAEQPVGDLRFRATVPLDTKKLSQNKRLVDARNYPNFCVQGSIGQGDAGGAGTESCLTVNIYAPANATPKSNLPVLVYIHGGGYVFGNPANWPFDDWVDQFPSVVIVSVYYRLDAFGFLSHPSFLTDPSLGSLNAGFSDQTQALRWTQQFISSFGGDPSKVTINGQSAGGSSVELHVVAQGQEGLFRGAIGQSVFRTPVPRPEQQVELFNEFSQLAGCAAPTTAAVMACLRKAPISAIARAQDAPKNASYNQFHPVIDGKVITDFPTRLLEQGKFANVAVMVGSTSNETLAGGATTEAALKSYFPSITDQDISTILPLYPESDFASPALQMLELTGDHSVRCGREIIAAAAQKKGQKAFTYRYNSLIPNTTSVFHSSENWMMFRGTSTGTNGSTVFQPQNATELAFASELFAYWLSFVRTGDPNTFKLSKSPVWSEFPQRIVLQENTASTTQSASFIEADPKVTIARCQNSASLVADQEN